MKYYIKSHKWKQILKFLRQIKGIHTEDEYILRKFVESIWYMVRSGCQWRLLPDYYGCWRSIHRRFKRWVDQGIWEKLLEFVQVDKDLENVMIDATIVRAHACSSGYKKDSQDQEALGRSKGGFTTKIHAMVDALGNPLKFILTSGQRNDITQADSLIKNTSNTTVIADKGYDANSLILTIEEHQSTAVIPPKKNRKVQKEYDKHIYKQRHLIECFFGKIKHYRRIFSRFDKSANVYMGFLNFVGALIWLR